MIHIGIVKAVHESGGDGVVEIESCQVLFSMKDCREVEYVNGKVQFTRKQRAYIPSVGEKVKCEWSNQGMIQARAPHLSYKYKNSRFGPTQKYLAKKTKKQEKAQSQKNEETTRTEPVGALEAEMKRLPDHTSYLEQALEMLEEERIGAAIHFCKHLQMLALDFSAARHSAEYRSVIVQLLIRSGDRENQIDALEMLASIRKDQRTQRDIALFKMVKKRIGGGGFINRSNLFEDLRVHAGRPIDRVANRVGKQDMWDGKTK